MIENRAKIDPHSLRERHSTFFMKRRKVGYISAHLVLRVFFATHDGRARLGAGCR